MTIVALVSKIVETFTPRQICWLCLVCTVGFTGWGFAVFARESDVTAIRAELLQGTLIDLRIRQCTAIKEGQSAAFFAQQVTAQTDKYEALTGRRPDIPNCAEL